MAGPPRGGLRRSMTVVLALTLFCLTLAAVVGSWRQAQIVKSVAAESSRTDSFQTAAFTAVQQEVMLQGTLREPGGEERLALPVIGHDLERMLLDLSGADPDHATETALMAAQQRALQPVVSAYLSRLDQGDEAGAQELLESQIEPITVTLREELTDVQNQHLLRETAALTAARRDSQMLLLGTVLTFLLGLAVLAVVTRSNRRHRRQLNRMAAHDALTGLPNRSAFRARVDEALSDHGRGGPDVAVLLLDLDGFKEVNDDLGHAAGDLLLVEVSRRLIRSMRSGDTLARLGGDEFGVLLTGTDAATCETVANRISATFDEPFQAGVELDIEASIGIATGTRDMDATAMLRNADAAMYIAKVNRLGVTSFDPHQARDSTSRISMLGDLRRALDTEGEIRLHYQPKIAIDGGAVVGAEALARWAHPSRGPVSPADFIPVLEKTGLIRRFTDQMLDLALAESRRWLDAGSRVPVAVNVSTRCLLDTAFADTVAAALARAEVPGDLLIIEITENTLMADPDRSIAVLHRIRAFGVKTSIDDFGTGYSSMAYLRVLPIDEIKVDRSFVRDMATDHSNHVLVQSTVDLAHNLGLSVVAEGVEDEQTVEALRHLGCDIAQGYLFARPLPAAEFEDFLTTRQVAGARTT